MTQLLVDVSSNNVHPVDFTALKEAGVTGVIVKITEGADYANPDAEADIAAAHAAGLGVSVYHFFHASVSIEAQSAWIKEHLPAEVKLLWIDIEGGSMDGLDYPTVGDDAKALIADLSSSTLIVGPYMNLTFRLNLPGAPWNYVLWLADPSHNTPSDTCLIHQFGQQRIGTETFDMDRWYGTDDQFTQLLWFAPPAAGTVEPAPPVGSTPEPAPGSSSPPAAAPEPLPPIATPEATLQVNGPFQIEVPIAEGYGSYPIDPTWPGQVLTVNVQCQPTPSPTNTALPRWKGPAGTTELIFEPGTSGVALPGLYGFDVWTVG